MSSKYDACGREFSSIDDLISYLFGLVVNYEFINVDKLCYVWRYLFAGRGYRKHWQAPSMFEEIKKDGVLLGDSEIEELSEKVAERIRKVYPNLYLERFLEKKYKPIWDDDGNRNFSNEEAEAMLAVDFKKIVLPEIPPSIIKTISNIKLRDTLAEALTEHSLMVIRNLIFHSFPSLGGAATAEEARYQKITALNILLGEQDGPEYSKAFNRANMWLYEHPVKDVNEQLEIFKQAVIASFNKCRQNPDCYAKEVNLAFWLFSNDVALIKIGSIFVLPRTKKIVF